MNEVIFDKASGLGNSIVELVRNRLEAEKIPAGLFADITGKCFCNHTKDNLYRADISADGCYDFNRFGGEVPVYNGNRQLIRTIGADFTYAISDSVRAVSNKKETYRINSFSKLIGVALFKYKAENLVWEKRNLNCISLRLEYYSEDESAIKVPEDFEYVEVYFDKLLDEDYLTGVFTDLFNKISEYCGLETVESIDFVRIDFDTTGYCLDFSNISKQDINEYMDAVHEPRMKPYTSFKTDREVLSTYTYREIPVIELKGTISDVHDEMYIRKPVKCLNEARVFERPEAIVFFQRYYLGLITSIIRNNQIPQPVKTASDLSFSLTEDEMAFARHMYDVFQDPYRRASEMEFCSKHAELINETFRKISG